MASLKESPGCTWGELMWLSFLVLVIVVALIVIPDPCEGTSTEQAITQEELVQGDAFISPGQIVHDRVAATDFKQPHAAESLLVQPTGERETKAALERIFGKEFVKIRPSFLTNPETRRRLELDCYNADLRLGVEYNGVQHYVFPNYFHRNREQFDSQQRRDHYKRTLCQQAGVQLLVVPYTVPRSQIESFLRQQIQTINFPGFRQ